MRFNNASPSSVVPANEQTLLLPQQRHQQQQQQQHQQDDDELALWRQDEPSSDDNLRSLPSIKTRKQQQHRMILAVALLLVVVLVLFVSSLTSRSSYWTASTTTTLPSAQQTVSSGEKEETTTKASLVEAATSETQPVHYYDTTEPTNNEQQQQLSLPPLFDLWDEWKARGVEWKSKAASEFQDIANQTTHLWTRGGAASSKHKHKHHAVNDSSSSVVEEQEEESESDDEDKWWSHTQEWFRHTWKVTENDAHDLWVRTTHRQHDVQHKEAVWWNRTVASERDWYNHTIQQLHVFGRRVQSWWNRTSDRAEKKEHVVERNFQHWWKHANEREREWWNETRLAYGRFRHTERDKEELWWNITREASGWSWNATKRGWNATRQATKRGWHATVETEEGWWNASANWFREHTKSVEDRDDYFELQLLQPLLYLNTTHAFQLVMNGYNWFDYSADFFLMQSGWDVQINQAYCAVASAAALLNSLLLRSTESSPLPIDPVYDPYPYATQHALLNNTCADRTVIHYNDTYDGIYNTPGGLNLAQAKALLECHLTSSSSHSLSSWNVTMVQVDPNVTSFHQMRQDLKQALMDPHARVLVNYDRAVLEQEGHGHFSPVAGYAPHEDAFLVMDVAKYKYPPAWVPAARLYDAMQTIDACGDWNFPQGQEKLMRHRHSDLLLRPNTSEDYYRAMKKLHCQTTYRGYILVHP